MPKHTDDEDLCIDCGEHYLACSCFDEDREREVGEAEDDTEEDDDGL